MRHTNSGEHQRATMSRANTPHTHTHFACTHTHSSLSHSGTDNAEWKSNYIDRFQIGASPTPLARDNGIQNGNRVPPFGMTWHEITDPKNSYIIHDIARIHKTRFRNEIQYTIYIYMYYISHRQDTQSIDHFQEVAGWHHGMAMNRP